MSRVLVTGAAGVVGTVLWEGLRRTHELRGIDRRPDRSRGIGRGDVNRMRSVARALDGVDAVVDLATGATVAVDWPQVRRDIDGRLAILEAARSRGVRRYVFASSNHVTGMYERDDPYARIAAGDYDGLEPEGFPLISPGWTPRPDSPYAVGKLFAESASRYYAERYGLSCICLRIGTVRAEDRPTNARHFATLLSHADLVQLVECALAAPPDLAHGVYYGVSANTWRFWDIGNAHDELEFTPLDDTERFRASMPDAAERRPPSVPSSPAATGPSPIAVPRRP